MKPQSVINSLEIELPLKKSPLSLYEPLAPSHRPLCQGGEINPSLWQREVRRDFLNRCWFNFKTFSIILFVAFILCGCTLAKVKVDVISERTSLENQVLGSYNSLDREMLLAGSVRGVDSSGKINRPAPQSGEQKDVINAIQVIAFHDDDVLMFRKLGWTGESNQGLLFSFGINKTNVPTQFRDFSERYSDGEFQIVFGKVNDARERIMKRIIEVNENLTENDMPAIRKVFAKMNMEKLLPGEKYQDGDGSWKVK